MRGRPRPLPLAIPAGPKPSFKLTDSGVFEEGGLVLSKAGCTLPNTAAPAGSQQRKLTAGATAATEAAGRPDALRVDDLEGEEVPPECSAAGFEHLGTDGDAFCVASLQHCGGGLEGDADGEAPALGDAQHSPTPAAERRAAAAAGAAASGGTQHRPRGSVALEDLQQLGIVGSGSGGVVKKVCHRPSGEVLVLKVIQFDVSNAQLRRQVATELRSLAGARHPHVVAYRESYLADGAVTILMEWMDGGSLADLLARVPRLPERALAEVARQVVSGLAHLHGELRIVHRDIKPSNLLLSTGRRSGARSGTGAGDPTATGSSSTSSSGSSSSGAVLKISDFGVSGQLSSSVSKCASWVGTVTYMSPERIRGDAYSFNTDIWSLGMVLVEAATGRFPYPPPGEGGAPAGGLGFWELLEYIVVEPAPRLPAGHFSPACLDFVHACLRKDPTTRPSASELLKHPWLQAQPPADLGPLLTRASHRASGAGLGGIDGAPPRGGGAGLLRGSWGGGGAGVGAAAGRARVRASGGFAGSMRSSGVLKLGSCVGGSGGGSGVGIGGSSGSGSCQQVARSTGGGTACSSGGGGSGGESTVAGMGSSEGVGCHAGSDSPVPRDRGAAVSTNNSSSKGDADGAACPTIGGLAPESSVIWGSSESPPAWPQPGPCWPADEGPTCSPVGSGKGNGGGGSGSSGSPGGTGWPTGGLNAATGAPGPRSLYSPSSSTAEAAGAATKAAAGPEAAAVGAALGAAALGARVTANLRYSGLRGVPGSSRSSRRPTTATATGTGSSHAAASLRTQQVASVLPGALPAAATAPAPVAPPQAGCLVQPKRLQVAAPGDERPEARGLPRYGQQQTPLRLSPLWHTPE